MLEGRREGKMKGGERQRKGGKEGEEMVPYKDKLGAHTSQVKME